MIGTNLHRYYEGRFIVPDCESNGLNLHFSRPLQWAWTIGDNRRNYETKSRYIAWPDGFEIGAEAAAITRFNRLEYTRQARPIAEVLDEFEADLYNTEYLNIWHSGLRFDVYMHDALRRAVGRPSDWSYLARLIDTDALSKAYLKGIKPDLNNFLGWQYKMANHVEKGLKTNLGYMAKTLKIEFDETKAHEGAFDTIKTAAVYRELLHKVEF